MIIKLDKRCREHVEIFWHRTQDDELKSLFPFTVSSLEEALQLYEGSLEEGARSFGEIIVVDDVYVGDVWVYGIDEVEEKMAMLSMVIFDKSYWNKGIGTEVVRLFMNHVSERYKIHSLGAFTYCSNIRSTRMLEKNGFIVEETFVEDGVESVFLRGRL